MSVMLKGSKETGDALNEAIVDDAFVLKGFDVVLALLAFLVDLVLFGADEGAFIDIRMDFNVRVIAELQGVLCNKRTCEYI